MIRLEGKAMSKSKGNVISPNEYFESVGADALRLYHFFAGPPVDDIDWNAQTDSIIDGCARYLGRVWRLATEPHDDAGDGADADADDQGNSAGAATGGADGLRRAVHLTIARVSADLDRYSFNTAVAACMELTNTISRHARSGTDRATVDEAIDTLLELLAPLVPHLAPGPSGGRHGTNLHVRPWPVADASLLVADTVTMVVQVNGKVRDRIEVGREISEDEAARLALASPKVHDHLAGAEPKRVVARPPRLVNIVI
jgi:leucyl-tRNA synthetase